MSQRSRLVSSAGLLGGGLLGVIAAGQNWWLARASGANSQAEVGFTGTEATGGLAQALALVVLAGTLLALALKATGKRIVGMIVALVGAAQLVIGVVRPQPSNQAVINRVSQAALTDQFTLHAEAWPIGYAGAGGLALVGGLLMVIFAARWPQRTDRFDRRTLVTTADADPAAIWKALDAGMDPTAQDPKEISPISSKQAKGARMEPDQGESQDRGDEVSDD